MLHLRRSIPFLKSFRRATNLSTKTFVPLRPYTGPVFHNLLTKGFSSTEQPLEEKEVKTEIVVETPPEEVLEKVDPKALHDQIDQVFNISYLVDIG